MKRLAFVFMVLCGWCVPLLPFSAAAGEVDVEPLLAKLRAVGPKGQGHREASAAWKKLAQAEADQLPQILAGMKDAGDLSLNWIRAVVETIAERQIRDTGSLPVKKLEAFLAQKQHAPKARRLAYELVQSVDESAKVRLIPAMLNDSSLELRRDAVEMELAKAADLQQQKKKTAAAKTYSRAFTSSRDIDQIKTAAEALRKLGEKPDVPAHLGYVLSWKVVGPFDNTDMGGFEVAYPPEKQVRVMDNYKGKEGAIRWKDHVTEDEYGIVDLAKALGPFKGACAYAFAVFDSDEQQPVELRLGCINANKIWLNGKLLTANEVYHANMFIDQYVGRGVLKKGRNEILVKICQNEQTEDWAQRWQFQLRVCDHLGTAIARD